MHRHLTDDQMRPRTLIDRSATQPPPQLKGDLRGVFAVGAGRTEQVAELDILPAAGGVQLPVK
jgi:hypothetical protein